MKALVAILPFLVCCALDDATVTDQSSLEVGEQFREQVTPAVAIERLERLARAAVAVQKSWPTNPSGKQARSKWFSEAKVKSLPSPLTTENRIKLGRDNPKRTFEEVLSSHIKQDWTETFVEEYVTSKLGSEEFVVRTGGTDAVGKHVIELKLMTGRGEDDLPITTITVSIKTPWEHIQFSNSALGPGSEPPPTVWAELKKAATHRLDE